MWSKLTRTITIFVSIYLISCSAALAVDVKFGEIESTQAAGASAWWAKDNEARTAMKAGSLDEAKRSFEEAVSIAEKNANMDPGLVNSMAGLALLEHKRGNSFESERLYELAMRFEEGFAGASSEKFAAFLPDLAWLYHWHGKTAQAEILYRRAIATIESHSQEDDPKLCHFLKHYKAFLTACGRTSEAEKIAVRLKRIDGKSDTIR
jgi:tetratricopeptide (TPR) repeat protein